MRFLFHFFVAILPVIKCSFEDWTQQFRIQVRDEFHRRELLEKWRDNDKFIEMTNARNLTYRLGHNQFSGMTIEEFSGSVGKILDISTRMTNYVEVEGVPDSVNWVTAGAVTPVKDQGQCGSCWSFSTTGALEGVYYNKMGTLISFSEQQLVDCDSLRNGGKDHGCKGGLMDNAFAWIENNGGLCSESAYPYISGVTMKNGVCQTQCVTVANSQIKSFVDVLPSSDAHMMAALAKQPVAIAIEADQREFQLYKTGVFTGSCGTNLDHGVLAVGYGSLDGQDYYLVKNSWSTSWGDDGYIMLGRGPQYNNGDGQCGLLLSASYPQL
uniref:Peptidase C1A papain C-terminal domain-containing protein n=1 Tax=viral metagenome TaxID=1070528 RepID=A0A6C0I3N9_9ZZZZ